MVSKKRHIAKAFTWRIIASLTTAVVGYAVTNSFEFGLMIGGIDAIIKFILYYIHERAWYKSKFGINENAKGES